MVEPILHNWSGQREKGLADDRDGGDGGVVCH